MRLLGDSWTDSARPERPRPAGVLALAYERAGEAHVLLTRRSSDLPEHGGQISFPGGAPEPGDRSLLETALRETREELGCDTGALEVVGELPPVYIIVTNFLVAPFVAVSAAPPVCRPDPAEVDKLIELPLSHLKRPGAVAEEVWELRGRKARVPFYRFGPHKIWGATARMLAMLAAAI